MNLCMRDDEIEGWNRTASADLQLGLQSGISFDQAHCYVSATLVNIKASAQTLGYAQRRSGARR